MRKTLLFAFSALSLASALPVAAQAPAPAVVAARPVDVPPLQFRDRTLANGMRVISAVDRSTATVGVQLFYKVGAKDDPPRRSGFAHLFEHLMFKRTRNMPDEMFDRLTEDVGGQNNASTADDYTNYYATVPANHLQRILWAEADRMSSLIVDQGVFASERDVVKEELRQRVLADPYGRFFRYLIPDASYTTHPYRRPGIGSIEDLDAASLEDVKRFHATYYRPDNAVLVVVGNFNPAEFDRWVDRYFAPIKRPAATLPRVTAREPARSGPKTVTGYGPNVPLPAVAVTWQIPEARHPDAPALAVLDGILSTGRSSRLYESLVYEKQLAQSAGSSMDINEHPGLLTAYAIMAGGKALDEGEQALLAEVERLRTQPPTPEELAEAKAEFVANAVRGRETAEGRAYALGFSAVVEGDPNRANTELARLQAVTAADVQRVAQRYLDPNRRVVVRDLPESERPGGAAATIAGGPQQPSPPAAAPQPTAAARPTPPAGQQQQPPAPGPVVPITVPTPAERVLPNGLRVIVATERDLPLVTAQMVVRSGAEVDPEGRAGLASMTASLLTTGAGGRSATEIAETVERLGASLNAGGGWDASRVTLSTTAPNLDAAAALMADVVRRPAFAPEELERLRTRTLDGLRVGLRQPGSVASYVMGPVVFGGSGYGHPAGGTPQSVPRITREDAVQLHQTYYRPDNAVLVLTGDITPEAGFALAERLYGDWARPASPIPAATPPAPAAARQRVVVVDMPNSGQAAVYVAKPGLRRSDPQYYTALVTDSLLGGSYSSRLNQEIRIRRGLSYGANSIFDPRREAGLFAAATQTKPESAAEVVDLVLAEVERLGREPAALPELTPRKAVLTGRFGRSLETTSGLANALGTLAVHGLPVSEVNRYLGSVEAVTPAQMQAYARSALAPGEAAIIVVGDAKGFLEPLRARFPQVEVIPIDRLNLESPTLQ
jgi:zinc protease